jgi:hypothetical protein
MKLEDSLRWQAESESEQMERLRATLGDSVNQDALDAMAMLYRAGWNDCFILARMHGVERL